MNKRNRKWDCIVRGCDSVDCAKMFKVPKNEKRQLIWLRALQRLDLRDDIKDHHKVCEKHFTDNMFGPLKKKLLKNAIPRIVAKPLQTDEADVFLHFVQSVNNESTNFNAENSELMESDSQDIMNSSQDENSSGSETASFLSFRTPRKNKMLNKISKLRHKIKLQDNKIKSLQSVALTKEKFIKKAKELLPSELYCLVENYLNNSTMCNERGRFSSEIKQLSRTIYFLSPTVYKFFQEVLLLPSYRTLSKLTVNWPKKPGLNEICFSALKIKTAPLNSKACIICLREMSLKGKLFYDKNTGEVIGFQDDGNLRQNCVARSAFVIMARGIADNWKQPLGYILGNSICPPFKIKEILIKVIKKLKNIELSPIALITDHSMNFQALAYILSVKKSDPTFELANTKLVYIFDPPYLIKSMRDNFIKYNMIFEGNKIAKWSDIEKFYNWDCTREFRLADKLTTTHLNPNNLEKMRVKLAVQTLSRTVACGIYTQVNLYETSALASQTAEFVEKCDKLFDMLNSSKPSDYKQHKNPFRGTEFQITEMQNLSQFVESIVVINKERQDVTKTLRCLDGLLITITGIGKLWEYLKYHGHQFLLTRRINQDCLENLFETIRKRSGNKHHPTPLQFMRSFKKLCSMEYIKLVKAGTCELQKEFISNAPLPIHLSSKLYPISTANLSLSLPKELQKLNLSEDNAFYYYAGYIYTKLKNTHTCNEADEKLLSHHSTFTMFKEVEQYKMVVPPEEFVQYLKQLEDVFRQYFDKLVTEPYFAEELYDILSTNVIPYKCCKKVDISFVLRLFIRVRIYFILKFFNIHVKDKSFNVLSVQSM